MLNLSFGEIMVVVAVFVLVNKPEDMPALFRKIKGMYVSLQRYFYNLKMEIMHPIEDDFGDLKKSAESLQQALQDENKHKIDK